MPTYDYQCDECGHEFELFQQMSAPVKRKCPECGLLKLRRLIGTGAGVLFKGSGFYETDYKRKGEKRNEPSTDKSSGASGKDAAKPAAKGEDGNASGKGKGDKGGKGSGSKPT